MSVTVSIVPIVCLKAQRVELPVSKGFWANDSETMRHSMTKFNAGVSSKLEFSILQFRPGQPVSHGTEACKGP